MCLAKGNVLGRLVGSDTFSKLDPVMGAVEKWDTKNVAPMFGQGAAATSTKIDIAGAPLQNVPNAQRRTQDSMLTATPGTGRGLSLLTG